MSMAFHTGRLRWTSLTRQFSTLRSPQCVYVKSEFHDIIKWNPPNRFDTYHPQRSCDMKPLEKPDPNSLQLRFRPFAERIDKLPEDERKIFTLALARRCEMSAVILEDTTASVKRHKYDNQSPEFLVAKYTVKIRNFQDIFRQDPSLAKSHQKSRCQELIQRRHKYLTILKNKDIKKFEWMLQHLAIVFKPLPEIFERLVRKECLAKLTDMYCNAIRSKRLYNYKVELDNQKVPFLEEKLATLKQIKADEESIRLPCSVDDQINETIERIEALKKNPVEIKFVEPMELVPTYRVPDTLFWVGETKTSIRY